MSDTGPSTKEISEENGDDGAQEISEENGDDGAQEISEQPNEADTQDNNQKHYEAIVTATEAHVEDIFKHFGDDSVSEIILTGEAGTGKTWIARKFCELAMKSYGEPLWISLEKKHDWESLYDTIARQFSLTTTTDAREDDNVNQKKLPSGKSVEEERKETRKERLEAVAEVMAQKEKLLIVLDGEVGTATENDKIEKMVCEILGLKDRHGKNGEGEFKVLITRRNEDGACSERSREFKVEPFSGEEASKLLRKNVVPRVSAFAAFEELAKAIREQDKVLPAEILILAGALNDIAKDRSGDWSLKRALEEATGDRRQLLRYAYDKEPGNSMIDCFWHSWHFLEKHGGVHYNELITNWIMEGYLKPTNQIEKAYEEGHNVLMKLIDLHLLKIQDDNVVVVEGATRDMKEYCHRGYSGTADPGLPSVLKDYEPKVLDGITPADGMMRTLCADKKEDMISSLLIDGSRLSREVHQTFFGPKQNLNVLSIFYPRLKSSKELCLSNMEKLLVLMLRNSYLLEDVNNFKNLSALTVLEISGSNHLKEIPDELFKRASKLRSLDLSGAGIESLPPSFTELTKMRRLILRQCSSLKELPKLAKFTELEVFDVSESTSLEKIQEKSFQSFVKLQVLNFSQTKLEKIPIVKSLKNLEVLLVKGCRQLAGMRTVRQVSRLKILDLSGSDNIREIMYGSFEGAEELRELDLSKTKIQFLPPDFCNLQKLRLKDCTLLKELPELQRDNSRLEELDLSGCESLVKLPDLSTLQNLKILDLTNCSNLESPLDLKSLTKLEKLHLSGTSLWSNELEESLSHLTRLKILK